MANEISTRNATITIPERHAKVEYQSFQAFRGPSVSSSQQVGLPKVSVPSQPTDVYKPKASSATYQWQSLLSGRR